MAAPRSRLACWGALLGLSVALIGPAVAAQTTIRFQTHAAFFSEETDTTDAVDPQVFVADPKSTAGPGPQDINHVAGFRPALVSDVSGQRLFTATGRPLGFTLKTWLGAKGHVVLVPLRSGGEKIVATFRGLVPGGTYSLFKKHFDESPIGFTPLDGTGIHNSFVASADGHASLTLLTPHTLTDDNAVLLVYHSDGQTHGSSRGLIGVTAHHHLIAPTK